MARNIPQRIALGLVMSLTGIHASAADLVPRPILPKTDPHVQVNVRDFAHLTRDGDWSPAIQAAIDYVRSDNGFEAGGTVFFPAGKYRVDRTLVLGNNPAHWGLRLLGYGATLVGTTNLDRQELVDPEPEEKEQGVPILVLKSPPKTEGAGFCIEGLRLIRERARSGVGISIPWKEVPKGTTFRSLKIEGQKVGIHIKYAWQCYFSECIFRGNTTGMIIQSQGNNIGIVNCIFRRQQHHGLVIGPDRGQWASNAQHISGSIFEANKGYGLLLLSNGQTMITGNYFEANGNDVGIMSPWETTLDSNLFWGSYGHGWRINPYSDHAHLVLANVQRVKLRNNHYAGVTAWFRRKQGSARWEYVAPAKGPQGIAEQKGKPPRQEAGYEYQERPSPILIVGHLNGDGNVFDALPLVHHKARITQKRVAKDNGLDYYEYDEEKNEFEAKSLLGR